ncbi:MAG: site-2 protease family protein [Planctomycetaceae bacterium]
MFGMAGETEFDLRFQLLGIPVRVHPLFWLMGAVMGWSPDRPDHMFLWVLAVFVSILVHEMGHAVMFRRYGYRGEIVLYMMGGYATGGVLPTWKNIIVCAAGPVAGFILAGLVILFGRVAPQTLFIQYEAALVLYSYLVFINIWWGLINLLPCMPLDGGQIMQSLVLRYWPRRGIEKVLWISIITAGGLALYGASIQSRYMMILFGILCAQHVIALNERNSFR